MTTLRTRLKALEAAIVKPSRETGFNFAPVMGYDEWCEAARVQQAALIKDLYDNA
jgi:hypothetical protein